MGIIVGVLDIHVDCENSELTEFNFKLTASISVHQTACSTSMHAVSHLPVDLKIRFTFVKSPRCATAPIEGGRHVTVPAVVQVVVATLAMTLKLVPITFEFTELLAVAKSGSVAARDE